MEPASEQARRCRFAIIPEEDESFSAIALNLPGIGSCGSTREEAVANANEALMAAIESYEADGLPIPWRDELRVPKGARLVE